ncbi:MAG: hypothetical protein CL758_06715 [Chloroflexi bacterium]|nr:hypothetical protein [Chloroflexota bacterium]|tara:strand:+ start:3655 stop:4050 length:396 start_codon:yes stop_codon:yes gene_type:complete
MSKILLDKTIFIDFFNEDISARNIMKKIIEKEISGSVSPITLYDIWKMEQFNRKYEISITAILKFIDIATLSISAAKTAGNLTSKLNLDINHENDIYLSSLIVATAQERKELICTRNIELYNKFDIEIYKY